MRRHGLPEQLAGETGFTFIELLVVVAIIGILLAVAIPAYAGFTKGAHQARAASSVREAIPNTVLYAHEHGSFQNMSLRHAAGVRPRPRRRPRGGERRRRDVLPRQDRRRQDGQGHARRRRAERRQRRRGPGPLSGDPLLTPAPRSYHRGRARPRPPRLPHTDRTSRRGRFARAVGARRATRRAAVDPRLRALARDVRGPVLTPADAAYEHGAARLQRALRRGAAARGRAAALGRRRPRRRRAGRGATACASRHALGRPQLRGLLDDDRPRRRRPRG